MQYDLNLVSTDDLLNELRRRATRPDENIGRAFPLWAADVLDACSKVWDVSVPELVHGDPYRQYISHPRTAAIAVLRFREDARPLREIAAVFGVSHHSTVLAAVKRCDKLCRENPGFRGCLSQALKLIGLTGRKYLSPHLAAG